MTALEAKIANALLQCTFQPGSFDKKFVRQLPNWTDRDMTVKGRETMIRLLHKYRRQIANYSGLCVALHNQTTIDYGTKQ